MMVINNSFQLFGIPSQVLGGQEFDKLGEKWLTKDSKKEFAEIEKMEGEARTECPLSEQKKISSLF